MGQVDKIIRGLIAGFIILYFTNVISGTAANFRRFFAIIFHHSLISFLPAV
jgi:hypothetical protein